MTLRFADGVHWCVANNRVVLLDVKADTYSGLPEIADQAFRKCLDDRPLTPAERDALHDLTDSGLLVPAQTCAEPLTVRGVTRSLLDGTPPATSVSLPALADQILEGLRLAIYPLEHILATARHRKSHARRRIEALDDGLRADIRRFMASRRLLSRHAQCLRTSLALSAYLARRDFYPDVVIGVRMRPFAAHAWVQFGDIVLNDSVDEVIPFTPILVI